jgi:hypothetical protein
MYTIVSITSSRRQIPLLPRYVPKPAAKTAITFGAIDPTCLGTAVKSGPKATDSITKSCTGIDPNVIGTCTPLPACVVDNAQLVRAIVQTAGIARLLLASLVLFFQRFLVRFCVLSTEDDPILLSPAVPVLVMRLAFESVRDQEPFRLCFIELTTTSGPQYEVWRGRSEQKRPAGNVPRGVG